MSHFLNLLPFFIIALPAAAQLNNLICPSYNCGNVTIRYPFWRIDSESATQYCGYEGFGIKCSVNGNQSISNINLGSESYYVREIDYSLRNIYLTDYELSPVATGSNNCPRVRHNHNVSLGNLSLNFWYSRNLSFHFDCTDCPSFATRIPCLENNGRRSCALMMNNITEEPLEWDDYSCSENVMAKVFVEFADVNLLRDYGSMLERGFGLQWESMDTDNCEKCEQSGGRCGRHNSTGFMCFCSDGKIKKADCKGSPPNYRLKLGIGIGSTLISFVTVSIIYCIWKLPLSNCVASLKHKTKEDINIEAFLMDYGSLSTKRYKYIDIKKMTNSFRIKLGQGGFGQVYKGKLLDGRVVAVKVLNSSKANGQEFINEVASIGRTSHVNIVTLLGFCFDDKNRALVYEYMPNGSLEKFIHGHIPIKASEHIGVKKLYDIALGIAHGLDYLHRGCNTRILHLDIKPHNILLDDDFCPKIADFGLAKLYSRKESIVSMLEARGTIGYIAPEVYNKNFGGVSHKSDVYSYGMLLLEIIGGRKNVDGDVCFGRTSEIYFPDWIYNRLLKDDFLLDSVTTTEENDYARKMTIVGLWCIQPSPNQRPTINEVIEMLEGSMETLEVPPKPFFSSPPRSPATIYSTSESIQDTT